MERIASDGMVCGVDVSYRVAESLNGSGVGVTSEAKEARSRVARHDAGLLSIRAEWEG